MKQQSSANRDWIVQLTLTFFWLAVTVPGSSSSVSALIIPDPVLHFSVGAVAGGAGAVAAYPFDYIKSQMQTEYGKQQYENGWDAFLKTVEKNPLLLYKGVGVQVLGIAPEKGIKLGVNDVLAATSMTQLGGFPLWAQIVSGGISGACQVVASSPLEVMKVGLQTSDMNIQQVWKEVGGVPGLFRGAEACILRDVIFTAICFPLYAHLIHSGWNPFLAGALSGVISSFACTPPDVIKTRILSQDALTRDRKQQQQRGPLGTATTTTSGPVLVANMPSGEGAATAILSLAIPLAISLNSTAGLMGDIGATTIGSSVATVSSTHTLLVDQYSNQDNYNKHHNDNMEVDQRNPFVVGKAIVEREGFGVLFSGVSERCLGAIPRFGTTLAMHDVLENMIHQAGWLSHNIV